jgi:hypothetical protein
MIDYKKASDSLGVEEAAIKAVASVESSGNGFITDSQGNKIPKILFERHIMFRRLRDFTPIKSKDMASKYPDIVNEKSGGYKGGLAEHERLQRAVLIDRTTALESASWGSFQLMGYHWSSLGYSSIQAFINDMYTEQGQLDAFVKFIKADNRLVKALKEKDWATFSRIYNGPAYKTNKYDTKMKDAYEKFSKSG